ncbi:MAG: hypothetical protein OXH66_07445 [Gemmatimonadetes bacterium]|nr:hypothetical protein [Gemmatimonadota bacterium]
MKRNEFTPKAGQRPEEIEVTGWWHPGKIGSQKLAVTLSEAVAVEDRVREVEEIDGREPISPGPFLLFVPFTIQSLGKSPRCVPPQVSSNELSFLANQITLSRIQVSREVAGLAFGAIEASIVDDVP